MQSTRGEIPSACATTSPRLIPALAPHYEIVVTKDGNLDKVQVKVELTTEAQNAPHAEVSKELQHHIKSVVGISTRVDIVPTGDLPRSEGKAKRVFDKR
jgi:phenylacetate-CoA ligase